MHLTFTAQLEPVPQPRPRVSRRGGVYESQRVKAFKAAIRAAATAAMNGAQPTSEPLACVLKFYRKFQSTARNFGDVDNLAKAVLDAVTGVAFLDDSQIVSCLIQKFTDKISPRVEVEISAQPVTSL